MVTSICFYFAKEVFGPIQSFKCLHKHTRLPTHALIAVFAGNLNVIVLKVHLALLSRQRSFQINGRNAFLRANHVCLLISTCPFVVKVQIRPKSLSNLNFLCYLNRARLVPGACPFMCQL